MRSDTILVAVHYCKLVHLLTCAGLGGAVGYALGGLDWTDTFLGAAFKSQEQILFFFAAILFSVSVVLHLLSIEEAQYSPQNDRLDQVQFSKKNNNRVKHFGFSLCHKTQSSPLPLN